MLAPKAGRVTPARNRKLQMMTEKYTGITTLPRHFGIDFGAPDSVTRQLRLSGICGPLESSTHTGRLRADAPAMHGLSTLPQDPSPPRPCGMGSRSPNYVKTGALVFMGSGRNSATSQQSRAAK